ncbi:MAG: family 10 glycosylhydrolase [Gemmatimonadaceae bacterium]
MTPKRGVRCLVAALRAVVLLAAVASSAASQNEARPPATRGLPYAPLGGAAVTDTIPPPVSREFRAVWVATVENIDWPSRPGLPADSQRTELLAILNRAVQLHLNAVIFQVRPGADAMYESRIEPWSYFLTGQMGRAPEPKYDPLAFAITEAHKRGIELHAWFNPYRARHPGDKSSTIPASYVGKRTPSLVKKYGPFWWMDPGEAEVRRLTTRVITDVVERYDIDGVHIDDYFYPYPETARVGRGRRARRVELSFPDDRSWNRYRAGGGELSRDDWRRHNVDLLVEELYGAIKKTKPWVKFGVSPFGIWRPGFPSTVRGLDAYDRLFADSRRWLNEGWLDYWTPQLYWRSTAPQQSYSDLLTWWRAENQKGRNIWPGNFTSRASARGRTVWPVSEIFEQIAISREQLGNASGNVHFSMDAFMANTDSIVERLAAGPYHEPALVPASPWLSGGLPDLPLVKAETTAIALELTIRSRDEEGSASPALAAPRVAMTAADRAAPPKMASARRVTEARWWVVRARYDDGWHVIVVPATERMVRLLPNPDGSWPVGVSVNAIDHSGVESPPARQ